jgi:quinol monooxygenase YgiN
MIVVTAKMTCHPGREAEFIAAAEALIGPTLAEEGCEMYDFLRYVTDPSAFAFVEEWRDKETFGAHNTSEHLAAFRAVAQECIAAQSITIHTVEKTRRF